MSIIVCIEIENWSVSGSDKCILVWLENGYIFRLVYLCYGGGGVEGWNGRGQDLKDLRVSSKGTFLSVVSYDKDAEDLF